jgi:hypothetical protein
VEVVDECVCSDDEYATTDDTADLLKMRKKRWISL